MGVVLAEHLLVELPEEPAIVQGVVLDVVEIMQDVRLGHAHGLEQDGGGHLPAPVNTDIEDVLVVEVEVEPRPAHGDDAAGIEDLAAGVGLA